MENRHRSCVHHLSFRDGSAEIRRLKPWHCLGVRKVPLLALILQLTVWRKDNRRGVYAGGDEFGAINTEASPSMDGPGLAGQKRRGDFPILIPLLVLSNLCTSCCRKRFL